MEERKRKSDLKSGPRNALLTPAKRVPRPNTGGEDDLVHINKIGGKKRN